MNVSGGHGSSVPAGGLEAAYQGKTRPTAAVRWQAPQTLWSYCLLRCHFSLPPFGPLHSLSHSLSRVGHVNVGDGLEPRSPAAQWSFLCSLSSPSPRTALLLHSFSGRGDPQRTAHVAHFEHFIILFYYKCILEPKIKLYYKKKKKHPQKKNNPGSCVCLWRITPIDSVSCNSAFVKQLLRALLHSLSLSVLFY